MGAASRRLSRDCGDLPKLGIPQAAPRAISESPGVVPTHGSMMSGPEGTSRGSQRLCPAPRCPSAPSSSSWSWRGRVAEDPSGCRAGRSGALRRRVVARWRIPAAVRAEVVRGDVAEAGCLPALVDDPVERARLRSVVPVEAARPALAGCTHHLAADQRIRRLRVGILREVATDRIDQALPCRHLPRLVPLAGPGDHRQPATSPMVSDPISARRIPASPRRRMISSRRPMIVPSWQEPTSCP